MNKFTEKMNAVVEKLAQPQSCRDLFREYNEGAPLPSGKALEEIIELVRSIMFPGYYGNCTVNTGTLRFHLGVNIEKLYTLLIEQIQAGLSFADFRDVAAYAAYNRQTIIKELHRMATVRAQAFIERLPEIRRVLATDVKAAYDGDPAAKNFGEIISCYPIIKVLTIYRMAHALWELEVPLIPRMLTELAHSETGVDIHPGAQIGKHFTIDHGTGVVIGETTIIGNNVKLYQGVTLGAKSFPLDENGNPIKGILRHPIIEDDVIIYSNATILGRVTIGKGAVIGSNVSVSHDVPAGTTVTQK